MSQAALIDALKVVNTHCAAGLAPDNYATELGTAIYGNTDGPGSFQTYDVSSGNATYSGGSVLSIIGSVSANRVVTLPTAAARYSVIVNVTPASGGPYTVTIKTAASGKQTLIYPTIAYGDTRNSSIPILNVIVDSDGNVYASDFSLAGSNSNGSYIKFGDGTMICYGTTSWCTINMLWAAPLYRGEIGAQAYPCAFVALPACTYQSIAQIGNASFAMGNGSGTLTATPTIDLVSPSNGATGAAAWTAVGRWKA